MGADEAGCPVLEALSITARLAGSDDISSLLRLYRALEVEMTAIHPMWPLADGLPEPVEQSLSLLLEDPEAILALGELDGYPFGFVLACIQEILPQAGPERIGSIRLVYVEPEAREVALGETIRDFVMNRLRERGITKFDAHVLPGHRLAKNFFEAGGFSARSIIMHHDDHRK